MSESMKSAGIALEEPAGQEEPGCADLSLCLSYTAPGVCPELGSGFTLARAGWSRRPTGK